MSERLETRFRAFKLMLLQRLSQLSETSTESDLAKANGTWKRLRREAITFAASGGLPGEAKAWFRSAIYSTPEFKAVGKLRDARRRADERYQEGRREYAKRHYDTVGKDRRSAPEVRAKLAAQRRERYARKKAQAQAA